MNAHTDKHTLILSVSQHHTHTHTHTPEGYSCQNFSRILATRKITNIMPHSLRTHTHAHSQTHTFCGRPKGSQRVDLICFHKALRLNSIYMCFSESQNVSKRVLFKMQIYCKSQFDMISSTT